MTDETTRQKARGKAPAPWQTKPFSIMTKPVGPICNLDCTYCYYLEKEKLFGDSEKFRMSNAMLDKYVREYIQSQSAPEITFTWQGGEPTLLGIDFFRRAVDLQEQYGDGRPIHNSLQTNGTLLNDEWAEFFAEKGFLIGLSVDGPADLHDVYRVDKRQKPTFDRVMRGLEFLKKHGAAFNTLTVVNRKNSKKPLKVYRFLKEIGSDFIQFIPLVERKPDASARKWGLDLAAPPDLEEENGEHSPVTAWSVGSIAYGDFLIAVFDEWVRNDVGKVFVQIFDVALNNWMGRGSPLCVFAEKCGRALVMEHNGDVYSCDHYVYPKYKLGNLAEQTLGSMVDAPEQIKFGEDKASTLPKYCRDCEVRFACNGECPKHRFMHTPSGEPGLNYLCGGYKKFFNHIDPYMGAMCRLLNEQRAPADVMTLARQWDQQRSRRSARK